jgi:uncharacterized beta-barrel protein YwiB (DUF1934 family)
MKYDVVLSIRGQQRYQDQEPDSIELVTEGTLEYRDNGWDIAYEESDLTGLAGVTTTFRIEQGKVTLIRSGKLNSQMVFKEGVSHDSLYQMEFGTMLMTVCAKKVSYDLTEEGGTVDLVYSIEIEHSAGGLIDYHLDIQRK